ncbi:MAG: ABC transporter ATP-binding protein [Gemmatimonadetes bacterium]|nr:ABC transporter ATP-binding protein [Gemmatimonadota bacterium]
MTQPLVEAKGLWRSYAMPRKTLFGRRTRLPADRDVTLTIGPGETLGLVGESGSGKSTVGRLILGLEAPDVGEVLFDGRPLEMDNRRAWREERRNKQLIFQDPLGALNPRHRVLDQVAEPLEVFGAGSMASRRDKARQMLRRVGLSDSVLERFPNALSGGQRQRIVIARALILRPRFLVCDEPISALDVSMQAQVVRLLAEVRDEFGLVMLFISHDLAVVRHIAHKVAVMYLGEIVETAPVEALFSSPAHPYTQALISAVPVPDPEADRIRILLDGEPPQRLDDLKGCPFHTRCPRRQTVCEERAPEPVIIDTDRVVSCHFPTLEQVA